MPGLGAWLTDGSFALPSMNGYSSDTLWCHLCWLTCCACELIERG